MHPTVDKVTQRIIERSRSTRQDYLDRMNALKAQSPHRSSLSCGNRNDRFDQDILFIPFAISPSLCPALLMMLL